MHPAPMPSETAPGFPEDRSPTMVVFGQVDTSIDKNAKDKVLKR